VGNGPVIWVDPLGLERVYKYFKGFEVGMDFGEQPTPDMHISANGKELAVINWKGKYETRHHNGDLAEIQMR
jgi:hypothetical protein